MRIYSAVRALFIGCVLFFCPLASPQDAIQLFHKMQVALGGADKIASIQDFEGIVRADAWHEDGRPMGVVRKRVRFIRPSYLRIDQVGREDTRMFCISTERRVGKYCRMVPLQISWGKS
jgi:hypothetical protein